MLQPGGVMHDPAGETLWFGRPMNGNDSGHNHGRRADGPPRQAPSALPRVKGLQNFRFKCGAGRLPVVIVQHGVNQRLPGFKFRVWFHGVKS